jgi:NADPH-dependent 2,4-dienoyl-CoA reductase/sulfur reductase-like enzyme
VNPPGRVVVVGASLAGLRACEAARRLGFGGRITLVGAEPHLPYDRPPLSKQFLEMGTGVPAVPWLPAATVLEREYGVELLLGEPATALDVEAGTVATPSASIAYDAALIATGAAARSLPGADSLDGVCTLRTVDDAKVVREAFDAGARTVVIGAGFIGAEVASAARKRDLPVTILEAQDTPLVRAVGPVAGAALGRLHARYGTELRCGVAVDAVVGSGHVQAVRLADGTQVPADLVVVGIGASPATQWLAGAGLCLDDGVVCDETLRAAPGVWAAGDVARWLSPDFHTRLRLEHWTNASEQAGHAVRNLLDPAAATPYSHIPYFWSDWYGSRIQFAGVPWGNPELVYGEWDAEAFTALYRHEGHIVGVVTLNRRSDIMKYRALIARGATWTEALAFARARNA